MFYIYDIIRFSLLRNQSRLNKNPQVSPDSCFGFINQRLCSLWRYSIMSLKVIDNWLQLRYILFAQNFAQFHCCWHERAAVSALSCPVHSPRTVLLLSAYQTPHFPISHISLVLRIRHVLLTIDGLLTNVLNRMIWFRLFCASSESDELFRWYFSVFKSLGRWSVENSFKISSVSETTFLAFIVIIPIKISIQNHLRTLWGDVRCFRNNNYRTLSKNDKVTRWFFNGSTLWALENVDISAYKLINYWNDIPPLLLQ